MKVPAACSVRLTFLFLQSVTWPDANPPLADGWNRRNPAILRDVPSELPRCGNSPSLRGGKCRPPSAPSPYVDSSLRPECAKRGPCRTTRRVGLFDPLLTFPNKPVRPENPESGHRRYGFGCARSDLNSSSPKERPGRRPGRVWPGRHSHGQDCQTMSSSPNC